MNVRKFKTKLKRHKHEQNINQSKFVDKNPFTYLFNHFMLIFFKNLLAKNYHIFSLLQYVWKVNTMR